jgi:uncharacterized protein YyaL (SSP411 family)
LQDPRIAELKELSTQVAAAVAAGEPADAAATTLLLRRYVDADDSAPPQEVLGLALARALESAEADATVLGRAAWLMLFVEAAAIADDERIHPAVERLAAMLRAQWSVDARIDEMSASIEACLRAAPVLDSRELVQDAIDSLERVVGGAYRPGEGLVHDRRGVRRRCDATDHVRGASALLTGFELTGRLPYSMLAEELIAIAITDREPLADADLVISCEAVRVLCRLASLHDDPDYRGAAVIATGADYRARAARMLSAQSVRAHAASTSAAAAYGLALRDLLRHVR